MNNSKQIAMGEAMEDTFQRQAVSLGVDDLIETRIAGQRAYWPVDSDTTARLDRVRQIPKRALLEQEKYLAAEPTSKRIVVAAVVVIASLFGLVVLVIESVR